MCAWRREQLLQPWAVVLVPVWPDPSERYEVFSARIRLLAILFILSSKSCANLALCTVCCWGVFPSYIRSQK